MWHYKWHIQIRITYTRTQICVLGVSLHIELWHNRFGHVNYQILHHLSTNGRATKLPQLPLVDKVCSTWMEGRHRWHNISFLKMTRAHVTNEIIHADICGPLLVTSLTGSRYLVTFSCDFSIKTWVYFMNIESLALDRFNVSRTMLDNLGLQNIKIP